MSKQIDVKSSLIKLTRVVMFFNTYSRFLKANLSWSSTRAKFCQLIASLSVVLPQINLTKLNLEYLKFGF